MANLTPRFRPGTIFTTQGRAPKTCTVTDVLTTTNLAGEIVAIRYVAMHEFAGQILQDQDVLETTILRGLAGGQTWLFNWTNGGYNTVWASDRADAEFAVSRMGTGTTLVADLSTLREATPELVAAEEAKFSGMFN